jgi:hypothetical protein
MMEKEVDARSPKKKEPVINQLANEFGGDTRREKRAFKSRLLRLQRQRQRKNARDKTAK